jgi:hypothetical protein
MAGMSDAQDREALESAETALREVLAAYEEEFIQHEERVEASRARLALVGDEVSKRLARYKAAADLAEAPTDLALIKVMYWEHPEVPVKILGAMLGVGTGVVHQHVGEHTITRKCRGGCGRDVSHRVANRTAAKSGAALHWRWCPECAEERERRYSERSRNAGREFDELEAQVDAALAAGVMPLATYVELPGIPGTWRVDEAASR